MYKISSYSLGIFVFGLVLLVGCTPYMKGSMQLDYENYEPAIENFQEELSQNPDNWRAREKLGFAYYQTGQYEKSIDAFSQVLQQNPGRPYATRYLGLAYLKNGERSKAIEILKSHPEKQPYLVEAELKRQLTLLEISDSIHLARQALADEQELKTLPPKPGTVAVFYFKDISPDNSLRPFQKAMALMINTDLAQVGYLQMVERLRVQYLLREMELGQTGIVDEKTAPRAGRLLGAENLIVGTMEPRSLYVKSTVASTSKKEVVGTVAVGGKTEEFYIIEKEIVYNILDLLKVEFTPEEEKKFSQYHTKSLDAVIYFGQGLEALDAGKWQQAKDYFQKAVEEDPTFNLAVFYRDGCPSASAPSLAALSGMTDDELALYVERSITEAEQDQSNIAATQPEADGTDEPVADDTDEPVADDTGAINFQW